MSRTWRCTCARRCSSSRASLSSTAPPGSSGQASLGTLAYLEDRVAVAAARPQTDGTQIGCAPEGPQPATPLADPAAVDGLRATAGLEPVADYLAEAAEICSAD